jgi:hypothetical protein
MICIYKIVGFFFVQKDKRPGMRTERGKIATRIGETCKSIDKVYNVLCVYLKGK